MFEEEREGESQRKFQRDGYEREQAREQERLPEARIRPEGSVVPEADEPLRKEGHIPLQAVQDGPGDGEENEHEEKGTKGGEKGITAQEFGQIAVFSHAVSAAEKALRKEGLPSTPQSYRDRTPRISRWAAASASPGDTRPASAAFRRRCRISDT